MNYSTRTACNIALNYNLWWAITTVSYSWSFCQIFIFNKILHYDYWSIHNAVFFTENENITDRQFIQTTYKLPFQILQYEFNSFPGTR